MIYPYRARKSKGREVELTVAGQEPIRFATAIVGFVEQGNRSGMESFNAPFCKTLSGKR